MTEEQKNEQPQGRPAQEQTEQQQPVQPQTKKKGCGCFRKIVLTIIIILIVISLAFEMFGNKGIKLAVETAGTRVLNVAVTLDEVSLQPFAGKLELEELVVANPEGFETPTLLKMEEAKVKLSTASLLSDTIEIEYIKLDGIEFTLEQKGLTSNLQTILNSLPKKGETQPKEENADAKKKKNMHIAALEISNVTVNAKILPIPGQADKITFKLPDIKKTDIGGKDSESVDTAKLITMITEWISSAIAEAGTGILPDNLTDALGNVLDQLPNVEDITGQAAEQVQNIIGNTTKEGTEAIQQTTENVGKEIEKGIQGLFQKKE